jgi:hypothetical protein
MIPVKVIWRAEVVYDSCEGHLDRGGQGHFVSVE